MSGTGAELWKHTYPCVYTISYEAGPRACVTIHDGKAFALGAMGNLHCLDARSGDVLWARDLNTDYQIKMPIWGIASAPLIYKDLVLLQIGGKDACMGRVESAHRRRRVESSERPSRV